MTISVAVLIIISAMFHVAWNILGKKTAPSTAFFLGTTLFSVILSLPVYVFIFPPSMMSVKGWFFLLSAGLFQTIYYTGLGGGYRSGEMSYVYPEARALPVLLIPLFSFVLNLGSPIDFFSLFGMFLVFSGCLILPVTKGGPSLIKKYVSRPSLYALLAAFGTTGYTLVDSEGMKYLLTVMNERVSVNSHWLPLVYISYEMLTAFLFLFIYILVSKREQKNFVAIIKNSKKNTLVAGLFIIIAYGIILMVYPLVSNVSYVTAFRQISIPLGAVAGGVILKEKVGAPKIIGISIICAGLLLVYL